MGACSWSAEAPERRLEPLRNEVRRQREQLGWSQEQLADASGLHRTYVGGVERGERNVSLLNILAIRRALGVTAAA
jgi:transcriptional regulator with XRE-family HTH domain